MAEETPNKAELAALELYHQLVNLSAAHDDNALMVTLRLPNGRYVGDVWLSAPDVESLTDASMGIGMIRAGAEQHAANKPAVPVDAFLEAELEEYCIGLDTEHLFTMAAEDPSAAVAAFDQYTDGIDIDQDGA
jgi:hypothetical protein